MVGKLAIITGALLIGLILLSGCTQPQQMYVCPSGDTVSNPDLCPKEDAQSSTSGQQTTVTEKAKLALAFDGGEEFMPQKLILDEQEVQPKSTIDISQLPTGNHQIVITVNDVEFIEEFYFAGNDISIQIKKPIETFVAVFSRADNSPISNVTAYVDGKNKCITGTDGTCSFYEKPGTSTFRIQGEGIFLEEIKNISTSLSSFTFKIERKISVTITVLDELTNSGVGSVEVYLNGTLKGKTESNGALSIPSVDEDSYMLEVKKEQSSNTKTIQISSTSKAFSITIQTPRTLSLTITDSETGKPVSDERVYLNGVEKGRTTQEGTIQIINILPGEYKLTVASIDAGYINIANQASENASVNMPNPSFIVGATLTTWFQGLNEVGRVTAEIHNNGNIASEDSIAVVSVYMIDGTDVSLLSQDIIRFGGIASGEGDSKESGVLDTSYWKQDDITVVVFDKSKYLPEQNAVTLSINPDLFAEVVNDTKNWCSSEKEECAKVAGMFVGTAIKAAGYGGTN